jgi:hypothetical protein
MVKAAFLYIKRKNDEVNFFFYFLKIGSGSLLALGRGKRRRVYCIGWGIKAGRHPPLPGEHDSG